MIPFKRDEPMNETLQNDQTQNESSAGGGVAAAAVLEAKKNAKRKPGRPPGSKSDVKSGSGTKNGPNDARITEEINKLFAPKMWEPVVSIPAAAMLAMTGHERWKLADEERKNMAATVGTAMQYVGIQNPKALAISMALITCMSVYAPRAVAQLNDMRQAKNKATTGNDV